MAKNKEEIIDLEGEEWRDVGIVKGVDFTGWYEVSNKGRARSLDRIVTDALGRNTLYSGCLLTPFPDSGGYMSIYLKKNECDKTIRLHRLIALRFIPNPDPEHKTQVNHIDEDKTNNCVENLEWVTNDENSKWGTKRERQIKSSGCSVVQIDFNGKVIGIYPSIRDVTRKTGLRHPFISYAIRNKIYITEGYFWITELEYNKLNDNQINNIIKTALYNKENGIKPDCSKEKEILKKKRTIVKLSKSMEYIEEYNSVKEAASQNNITSRNISDCLSGKHKTSGGFIWMRLYDFENINK